MAGSVASDDSDYDSDKSSGNRRSSDKPFICGVVEGFYGRPWNTHQRLELFSRMKKFGMNTYLYAPKDDVKHRAYWRDLYTVEEAESLIELIKSANKHGIQFVYAISPGLDMTYSSNKDLTILRRKLDQVSSFGCTSFALLFDDILSEMNKCDKEAFASFAHAQSSVTNQMYEHLKQPSFLFCPTEYCFSRAVPTVLNSQYLNTIGEKLIKGIEIMWTGPKVVSKTISLMSIKELTTVLRRPPLIWDNIHANDYDQKRIYLGPFAGRNPSLIPYLAGVLTNPNCEFEPNFIALHTLATWSRCNHRASKERVDTAETSVEREGLSKLDDSNLVLSSYDPKLSHRLAVEAWLPTLYIPRQPDGGHPPPPKLALAPTDESPVVNAINLPILSNIPTSVMTCMAVTPITQTPPVGLVVPTTQLVGAVDALLNFQNTQKPSETSKASEGCGEPMDVITDKPSLATDEPEVKDLLPNSLVGNNATSEDKMQIDEEVTSSGDTLSESDKLTVEELELICDMFYLPFEHGAKALHVLCEFQWLKINSHSMHHSRNKSASSQRLAEEWFQKATEFDSFVKKFADICNKFQMIPNRCLMYDLNNYLWDLRGTISVLNSYLKWLGMAQLTTEADCEILDCRISWSTKGYSEAFLSGDNEPWVFRGGLTGELQRLLPIDNATDLFSNSCRIVDSAESPIIYTIRPYLLSDEAKIYAVCREANSNVSNEESVQEYGDLVPDLLVGGLLTLTNQFCFVVENDDGVCGYTIAAPNVYDFNGKMALSWLPEMQKKYPVPVETDNASLTKAQELMSQFHHYETETSESLLSRYPALLKMEFLPSVCDLSIKRRTLTCIMSALKTVRVQGMHSLVDTKASQHGALYRGLGFTDTDPTTLTTVNEEITVLVRAI